MKATELEKTSDEAFPRKNMPRGKPLQSKLRPFHDQIALWQREGMSLRKIAATLREQHGLEGLHHDTVHSFISVRARKNARSKRRLLPADAHVPSASASRPSVAHTHTTVPAGTPSRVVGSDGKEIRNALYSPVIPHDL